MRPKNTCVVLLLLSASAAFAAAPAPGDCDADAKQACECAANARCWKVAMQLYATKAGLAKEDIEKSMPGRFIPKTEVASLRKPDAEGHFLSALSRRRPSPPARDEMEKRVIFSSLLSALPLNLPEGVLFDPSTWKITERGEKAVSALKSCRPGLFAEIVPAAQTAAAP